MDDLQPVFLGMTTKELWAYIHPIAFAGWGLLLVAPFWTRAVQYAKIPSLIQALLYAAILIPKILADDGDALDVSNMASVQKLFEDPDVFFCGWVHYLCFDLLVGSFIAQDALALPLVYYYLAAAPCMLLALYLGPVGFLLYNVLKWTVLPATTSKTPNDKQKAT